MAAVKSHVTCDAFHRTVRSGNSRDRTLSRRASSHCIVNTSTAIHGQGSVLPSRSRSISRIASGNSYIKYGVPANGDRARRDLELWSRLVQPGGIIMSNLPEHPAPHRQHDADTLASPHASQRRTHSPQTRERESDRQHEGPDGARHDRNSRSRWTASGGRNSRRVLDR